MPLGQNYLGLFFQGGDPLGMNESELQYPGQLGLVSRTKCRDDIDRDLQIVQVDSIAGAALLPGTVTWWQDEDQYKVTSIATLRGRVAGIIGENVGSGGVTSGNYTAIVKRGRKVPVKIVDAPTTAPSTAGLFVFASATSGRADSANTSEAADFTLIGSTIGAQDATTKNALCDVDVFASTY